MINCWNQSGANPSFLFKEGQSMNTIFAVKSLGIDPSNGKEIFLDPGIGILLTNGMQRIKWPVGLTNLRYGGI